MPLADTPPKKLAEWNGLKPEGLIHTPENQLLVLFDEGGRPPLFTSISAE